MLGACGDAALTPEAQLALLTGCLKRLGDKPKSAARPRQTVPLRDGGVIEMRAAREGAVFRFRDVALTPRMLERAMRALETALDEVDPRS